MKTCMAVLLLAIAASVAQAEEPPPSPVNSAEILELDVADVRSFVGTVVASRESVVGNEVDGLVVEYLVEEGDRVETDQPIARLRTATLKARLAAARAELESREAQLSELRNGSRPEEKRAAKARVQQATADLDLRRWKLDAARRLRESKTISIDELREAELAVRAGEEREKEAAAALELVEAGPRSERIAQAAAAVKAQAAEVARLEDDEKRHTIRAPFEGYVVAERTQVGQWLKAGDPVAEIAALDQVDVVIPVLEDFVGALRKDTPVAVYVGALEDVVFDGTIHRIVPLANPRARTFPVKIRIQNVREGDRVRVKAGMFARVKLAVGAKAKALVIPKDALVLGGPRPVVYVIDPDTSSVKPVPVDLGVAHEGYISVEGPLKVGMRIVVRGNERLRPGQKIRDMGAPAPVDK